MIDLIDEKFINELNRGVLGTPHLIGVKFIEPRLICQS